VTKQEVVRKAQAEYHKAWRKRNPDKVKATMERYWLKKAREMQLEQEEKQNGIGQNAHSQ